MKFFKLTVLVLLGVMFVPLKGTAVTYDADSVIRREYVNWVTKFYIQCLIPMCFFTFFYLFFFPSLLWAVPANPTDVYLVQPDGTKVKIYLRGDEFYHWNEDENGYTALEDSGTRFWVYAEKSSDGSLRPSIFPVGSTDPSKIGVSKHLADSKLLSRAKILRVERYPTLPKRAPITIGTMKNLVILAKFADQNTTYLQSDFDPLFNQNNYTIDGAAGSVKDYYHEVSYNNLTIESVVVDWVTLPYGYAYYGENNNQGDDKRPKQMVIDAINALDNRGFDFNTVDGNNDGKIDGLTIIHSGRGEEYSGNDPNYIWSHQWELDTPIYKDGVRIQMYHTEPELRGFDSQPTTWGITRIGVICHETGHFLELPDLYDYGHDSQGVGYWCLMAGGCWGGGGTKPVHPCAWAKLALGWVTPTVPTSNQNNVSFPNVEANQVIYKLWTNGAPTNEYFLVENRQQVGFDGSLPGAGLMIWHIDDSMPNNDNQWYPGLPPANHYKVAVEPADRRWDLEHNTNAGDTGDPFPGSTNNTAFTPFTTPDSDAYQSGPTGVEITNISSSAMTMTADLWGTLTLPPKVIVYPNPLDYSKNKEITFIYLPNNSTIKIFTLAGELVTTINATGKAKWQPEGIASGIYIYVIEGNGEVIKGKLGILR